MDWIGSIGWRTEVDTTGVESGVARAEAELRAAMRRMDGTEATAHLRLRASEVDNEIARVKRELLDFEDDVHEGHIDLDTDDAKERLGDLRHELKRLGQEKLEIRLRATQLQAARREAERLTAAQAKTVEAAARVEEEQEKAAASARKHATEVERLRYRYGQLIVQAEKLARIRPSSRRTGLQDLELDRLRAEAEQVSVRVQELGGSVSDITPDIERHDSVLRRWGSSLSNIRIHLGFASLTIKQLGIALVTLGPILTGLIGTASALIGVLGEGILGAGLLAGTGLLAAVTGFLGIKAAIAPVTEELGTAMDAFTNYREAVSEFGKGSQEARAAQEELNGVLKNVDPQVASVARKFTALREAYQKLTEPTRGAFFAGLEDALDAAKRGLPAFARAINDVARQAQLGFRDMFARLTDTESLGAFSTIMKNFADSIVPLMGGLTNIVKALMNVGASVSRYLDPAANSFREWSANVLQASRDTESLDQWVDGLMDSASSVGRFFGAAGNTLWAFFTTGADEGRTLLDDMTSGLNDITDWIKSAAGQASLRDFFADAVDVAKDLWSLISNMGELILNLSEAARPLIDAFIEVADTAADIVNFLSEIPGLMSVLQIGAGAWFGNKLLGGAAGLLGLGGAYGRLGQTLRNTTVPAVAGYTRAQGAAGKATITATGQIRQANGQFGPMASKAQLAASKVGMFGAASTGAGMMVRGLGARVLGFLGPVGLVASLALFAGDALGIFGDEAEVSDEQLKQLQLSAKGSDAALRRMGDGVRVVRAAGLSFGDELARGGERGAAAAIAYRQALEPLRSGIDQARRSASELWQANVSGSVDDALENMINLDEAIEHLDDTWKGGKFSDDTIMKKIGNSIQRNGVLTQEWEKRLRAAGASNATINELKSAIDPAFTRAVQAARQGTGQLGLALANMRRQQQGLERLPNQLGNAFGNLSKQFGRQQVIKWAVQVDDRQAASKLIKLAADARRLGATKASIRAVMEGDGSVASKLRRLESMKQDLKNPARFNVTANENEALHSIEGVQRNKRQVATPVSTLIKAIDQASPVIAAIKAVLDSIPRSITVGIRAVGSGLANAVMGGGATGGTLTVRGPDAVPKFARGGAVQRPMFVVGEESPRFPEYVIATNPAYRQANVGYLIEAARMLGLDGFKKGGKPGKGKGGGSRRPSKLARVGALDESKAQAEVSKYRQRVENKQEAVRDAQRRNSDKDKKNNVPASKLERLVAELNKAQKELSRATANLQATREANRNISRKQADVDYYEQLVQNALAQGKEGAAQGHRNNQVEAISDLIRLLQKQVRVLPRNSVTRREIETRIAQLQGTKYEAQHPEVELTTLTEEEQKLLERYEAEQALAGLTPQTSDDLAAGQSLVNFWTGVLARLQAEPVKNWAGITEAAQALASAREAIGSTQAQIAQDFVNFDTSRLDLYKSFGSNVRWDMDPTMHGAAAGAAVREAERPGPAATPQTGGGNTVNNYFQEGPKDPHTWSKQQAHELATLGTV